MAAVKGGSLCEFRTPRLSPSSLLWRARLSFEPTNRSTGIKHRRFLNAERGKLYGVYPRIFTLRKLMFTEVTLTLSFIGPSS